MNNIRYQLIKINVPAKDALVKFSVDTDKKYEQITGLYASLPEDEAIAASTLELKISNEEIFPEDFEVKMITCSQDVSPNERFYEKVQHEAAGNTLEGRFTDGGNATSYPYTAVLYLRLENIEIESDERA